VPLLQYCRVDQREKDVQETRQEKGKAGERHSMKKTAGGRQVMNETLEEWGFIR
jgi:hypothetical protein